MRCRDIYLVLYFLVAVQVYSQGLHTSLDWAKFEYDGQNAYVEFYYSLPSSAPVFVTRDGKQIASTLGVIRLRQNGLPVKEFAWKSEAERSGEEQPLSAIVDKIGVAIPYGNYDGEFVLKDLNQPQRFDSLRFPLSLPPPSTGVPRISEIQVAGNLFQAAGNTSSPFYKNGLIVEPNPSLIFSFEKPMLFSYVEAYEPPKEGYRMVYRVIAKESDDAVLPEKAVVKAQAVSPSVEIGAVNVGKLNSGAYRLVVEMQTLSGQPLAVQQKTFFVLQKEALAQAGSSEPYEDSVLASMDSSQIDLEFQIIFYLLSKEEQQVHGQIANLEGKRRFVYNFWHNKYPQYAVGSNPVREEYYRRYAYANEHFQAFRIDGWKTDRGRVYMIYGPPDDIERRPNEQNFVPYEIWFYQKLQNGVRFVFGDLEGYRNYRLVHSDLFGELQDANYMSVLRKGY
ncbi:MAG: GWxTD domain-containing protein [candidate division KSB1 bacterium]|nr:GWxTD domain-containing protein [candidate division KSB1 bacterium]